MTWSEAIFLYSFSGWSCNVAICDETWMTLASGSRGAYSGGGCEGEWKSRGWGSSMSEGLPKLLEVRDAASLSSSEEESSCSTSS